MTAEQVAHILITVALWRLAWLSVRGFVSPRPLWVCERVWHEGPLLVGNAGWVCGRCGRRIVSARA